MKVLVLNPPSPTAKNYIRDLIYGCWCKGKRIGGATAPPLNLLYVATVLKNEGHKVRFLDAPAEQKNLLDVKKIVGEFDVVVESTSQMSFIEDMNVFAEFKKVNPKLITIIFGSQPTFFPKEALERKEIDICIIREPEFIIRDILNALQEKKDWKKIKGVAYRKGKSVVINQDYDFVDINKLPIPDRIMLPKKIDYFNPIIKRMPYTTMMTSRGCPGKCTFCNVPDFYGNTDRLMTAKRVIEEIKEIVSLGYKEIWFRDETFTAFPERNKKICEWLIRNKVDLTWIANARVNMITKEMLVLMKKAGCHMIKFGVESGVQEILNNVKKGIKISKTREVFKWTHEVGIDTHAHMMLGMPGETKKTIEQTIKFAKEIDPTTVTFGICTPYAGTPLFKEVVKKDPTIKDGAALGKIRVHIDAFYNKNYTNVSNRDLQRYLKKAYKSFYFRPSYLFKWLFKIRSFDELKRVILAATNVFSFATNKKSS
ncbi:MAG: B12-binding domain-containing radical SAM protein [Nanoarchaeota archaeon]|nr:B12-binding domain-containing radical SAM protein [Nanoarchaeota archaeon]